MKLVINRCWICGKLKGQPPERCSGHYYPLCVSKTDWDNLRPDGTPYRKIVKKDKPKE